MGDDRPSRASMREVKQEYKARRKAEKTREKAAQAYWAGETGRPTTRRRSPAPLVVVAAVVAAAAAAYGLHLGPFGTPTATAAGAQPAPSATGSPGTTASAAATAAPSASSSSTAPGTDPQVVAVFGDSPAASWKKGMAGVALPTAHQVGIYSKRQVSVAYRTVRQYVAASMFDTTVLYQGSMTPVLNALGSFGSFARTQHAIYLRTHGKKGISWVWLATRFHPGDWRAAAETRSRGRIGTATISGSNLRVPFTVVTAYWLVPKAGGEARTIAVRREGYLEFTGYGPTNVWLYRWDNEYNSSASVCGSTWKYPEFIEAWTDRSAVVVASPSAVTGAWDMSDPDAPPPPTHGCYTNTSGFG